MEIKSLEHTDQLTIFNAFAQAFKDYELQLDHGQFQAMLQRRGFNPTLSFAAFEGDEIASFTLNGIGQFNGRSTAYDTGTGTREEYRGKGLAASIFEHSIPYLKAAGIEQYLLEVLQHNTKAVSLYKRLGFETKREFNYFMQTKSEVVVVESNSDFHIKEIEIDDISLVSAFWDFHPSWQNSIDSIKRSLNCFTCLGAYNKSNLIGYGIFEPTTGDITQMAVDNTHRKKGAGTALLNKILLMTNSDKLKVLNTDISCKAMTDFLISKNINVSGTQFEMIRNFR
ncbi:MAG: GNAT family N-acetyltransferase [Holophagaceae bacterium]|nr:GNAT family N-acetyltransferase [Holophagaceae bacterium]